MIAQERTMPEIVRQTIEDFDNLPDACADCKTKLLARLQANWEETKRVLACYDCDCSWSDQLLKAAERLQERLGEQGVEALKTAAAR